MTDGIFIIPLFSLTYTVFFIIFKHSDGELQNPPVPKDVLSKLARMEVEVPYCTVHVINQMFVYGCFSVLCGMR